PPHVTITLCDISLGMLKQADRSARRLGRRAALVAADAETLPFADGSFDTVLCSLSLCTIPDPVAVLREMKRLLRPGGRILLLEHVLSPLRPIAWLQHRLSPVNVRRVGCHLDRDASRYVNIAGLTIVERESHILGLLQLIVAAP
ncbi:MAG TPA: class I SAM-dependent methyltransferase, partial [Dehalococcoidia bacterium]|nr:class I SAM-dependent methyltransferase [Dehalococcoidia bacterium]